MTSELYTPPDLVRLAWRVLGAIDLDPATDAIGQTAIEARNSYTEADDGLSQPWHGNVYLFPPNSRRAAWTQKLLHEYRLERVEAALLYTALDPRSPWWQHLAGASRVCFLRGPLLALDETGKLIPRSRLGAVMAYLGPNADRFSDVCAELGTVMESV